MRLVIFYLLLIIFFVSFISYTEEQDGICCIINRGDQIDTQYITYAPPDLTRECDNALSGRFFHPFDIPYNQAHNGEAWTQNICGTNGAAAGSASTGTAFCSDSCNNDDDGDTDGDADNDQNHGFGSRVDSIDRLQSDVSFQNNPCRVRHLHTFRESNPTQCGNQDVTQTVFIVDRTLPEIYAPANYQLECSGEDDTVINSQLDLRGLLGNAKVSDKCYPTGFTESDGVAGNDCSRTITRTFSDTQDLFSGGSCGASTYSATQTATIVDTTPPTIDHIPEISLPCDINPAVISELATATDLCAGTAGTVLSNTVASYEGKCNGERHEIVTWSATDSCSNGDTTEYTYVNYYDNTPPVFTQPSSTTNVLCWDLVTPTLTAINPSLSDTCSTTNQIREIIFDSTNDSVLLPRTGYVKRTVVGEDGCGNVNQIEQVVYVNEAVNFYLISPEVLPGITKGAATALTITLEVDNVNLCSGFVLIRLYVGPGINTFSNTSGCDRFSYQANSDYAECEVDYSTNIPGNNIVFSFIVDNLYPGTTTSISAEVLSPGSNFDNQFDKERQTTTEILLI